VVVNQQQLAADVINIGRQLNATSADISDVSTVLDDVTKSATDVMTSAQAAQANVTASRSGILDLSDAEMHVVQQEANTAVLDNQVLTDSHACILVLTTELNFEEQQ